MTCLPQRPLQYPIEAFGKAFSPTHQVIPATAGIRCTATYTHADRAYLATMKDRVDLA